MVSGHGTHGMPDSSPEPRTATGTRRERGRGWLNFSLPLLFLCLLLLPGLEVRAQEEDSIPHTPTFPALSESPFPYVTPEQVGLSP